MNGPTIIAQGSLTAEEWMMMPFTIETDDLVGEKYYYLMFWLTEDAKDTVFMADIGMSMYHQIRVNYVEGPTSVVAIWDGADFKNKYTIHIEDGSDWCEYEAYIDNGSDWDICQ